jgi:hypothetical protein
MKKAKALSKEEEAKRNKRGEYTYTPLKDCKLGSDDTFHFYAVVLDASFPHKSFKSDKFICQLKIADPNSSFDKEGVVEHCSLMFFAKKFEDLPIC